MAATLPRSPSPPTKGMPTPSRQNSNQSAKMVVGQEQLLETGDMLSQVWNIQDKVSAYYEPLFTFHLFQCCQTLLDCFVKTPTNPIFTWRKLSWISHSTKIVQKDFGPKKFRIEKNVGPKILLV